MWTRTSSFAHYVDEVYDDLPCPPGGCDPTGGTPIEVVLGGTVAGIDFALERLGSISGTVTDAATGQPLSDLFVRVVDSTGSFAGDDLVSPPRGTSTSRSCGPARSPAPSSTGPPASRSPG